MRWLDFLHLVDSAFPTGAYAHSSGLETLGSRDLFDSLTLRLRETLGRFELVFLRYALDANGDDLLALDARFDSMLLPREARQASALIGTALLRGACELFDADRLRQLQARAKYRHQAVVFGAIAGTLDVPGHVAAQTYAFNAMRSQISAAQRLGWLGQRAAQQMLNSLKVEVYAAVQMAAELEVDQAGACAPAWDIASMAHAYAPARMFAS